MVLLFVGDHSKSFVAGCQLSGEVGAAGGYTRAMLVRLHAVDLGVVGLYLVAITLFGLRFAKKGVAKERSLRGYFLADKTVPWWAIALSIVSAETSTLTIIGTPGLAFAGDFGFLQIVLGYMCGRVVVALLFLPKYFQRRDADGVSADRPAISGESGAV